jgi:hypothetical protein
MLNKTFYLFFGKPIMRACILYSIIENYAQNKPQPKNFAVLLTRLICNH